MSGAIKHSSRTKSVSSPALPDAIIASHDTRRNLVLFSGQMSRAVVSVHASQKCGLLSAVLANWS